MIVDVVEEPVRPLGSDHIYPVALLTPVTETDEKLSDEQYERGAIVPPVGVATTVTETDPLATLAAHGEAAPSALR